MSTIANFNLVERRVTESKVMKRRLPMLLVRIAVLQAMVRVLVSLVCSGYPWLACMTFPQWLREAPWRLSKNLVPSYFVLDAFFIGYFIRNRRRLVKHGIPCWLSTKMMGVRFSFSPYSFVPSKMVIHIFRSIVEFICTFKSTLFLFFSIPCFCTPVLGSSTSELQPWIKPLRTILPDILYPLYRNRRH